MTDGIFPQSGELVDIIKCHGWAAVDVTQPKGVLAEWYEINQTPLAGQFEFGRMYLLVPQPRVGQTIEQTYKTTKGVPAILVKNHEDPRFDHVEIDKGIYKTGKSVPFTRLLFYDVNGKQGVATGSLGEELDARLSIGMDSAAMDNHGLAKWDAWLMQPDHVAVKAQHAVEVFKNYFRIAQPEEYLYFVLPEIVQESDLSVKMPDGLSQQAADVVLVLQEHIRAHERINVDDIVVRLHLSWLATEEAVRYLLREDGGLRRQFEGGSQLLVRE